MKNFSLKQKLRCAFGVLCALMLCSSFYALHALADDHSAQASRTRSAQGVITSQASARNAGEVYDDPLEVRYEVQRGVLIGLLLASVAAAVSMGWGLLRSMTHSLGGDPILLGEAAQRVAEGDLMPIAEAEKAPAGSVLASLAKMQQSLVGIVSKVRSASDSIATGASEIASGNTDLSQRTEQQAYALQQTASTMQQFSSTVKGNADNARMANQLASNAAAVASRGGQVVSDVVETMKGINDSSKRIGDIIGVIDSIAFQTNILALNAAVEAARAGEQGRGFAVVAGEVRSLAQRSAEAAKEIKSLIGASVEQVEKGSALVDQAGVTMSEVVQSIQRVSDIVGEISSASEEQNQGVAQIDASISQLDQATQQNAALVEQSAAAAQSLEQQAKLLVQTVGMFMLTGTEPQGHMRASRPMSAPADFRGVQPMPQPRKAAKISNIPATRPSGAAPVKLEAPGTTSPKASNKAAEEGGWEAF
ncbi:MAG: methyl-accepting chemotaxis protein [Curvibacter sp.]|nr:methyl-accepting chemotaxis protein [Curvibacter sp.]